MACTVLKKSLFALSQLSVDMQWFFFSLFYNIWTTYNYFYLMKYNFQILKKNFNSVFFFRESGEGKQTIFKGSIKHVAKLKYR